MHDIHLTEAIRDGKPRAVETLYDLYHRHLYYFFFKTTRDVILSEDLVQETFYKLWKYRDSLNIDIPISTQLFRIARTLLIDELRKKKGRKVYLSVVPAEAEGEHHLPGTSPESNMRIELESACAGLSEERKKIFILNREYGYTYKEIAHLLSISEKTVEKHISKTLSHLRNRLLSLLW